MKRLLRRLSRSSSSSSSPLLPRPKPSRGGGGRCRSYYIPHPESAPVPAGHLPLRVEDPKDGDGSTSRRFVVPAELLTAPAIAALLRRSAQEYGYEQSGVIRIPCPVDVFQRVLDSLLLSSKQHGGEEEDVNEQEWCYWDDDEEQTQQQQGLGWQQDLHRSGPECDWCC